MVIRTFSKAYGLAGMRVGYAVGAAPLIHAMRCVGSPYPVAGLSVAAALGALRTAGSWLPRNVERIRAERRRLREMLPELGAGSRESQGNFVLGEFRDAEWVWRALAGLGIAVRRFHSGDGLENSLRITCPGEEQGFTRLCAALRTALRPEALLIDMDGVIADVSGSYRRAIALTAESFGAPVTRAQIAGAKSEPGANNDWVVTHRLISRAGVTAGLDEVRWRFEEWYRGTPTRSGLELSERLLPERRALESLAARIPLGIVTGRPRRDCERFLTRFGLRDIFRAVVCMEDAPLKPDPAPVRLAMNRLGVTSAWMIGDTPDDVAAARAAGVAPIGIVAPGDDPGPARLALERAGAARIVSDVSELEAMLP
ncbi:MAG: hypothetical protein CVT83_06805 [Alphaproteobacteria bacterium HGW-Alphaproteobacteria-5]|nr:MAG: hypothetical protein CVT83_06805 [Alphaproteobacteria bacterium HGW-Alphaproteobacteria-5]